VTVASSASTTAGAASGSSTGLASAFFFGDLAALAAACARSSSPNCSLRRRTTGASIVEEADLTNSPMSLSVARTTLLSTPRSFASSCTRTFATALLLGAVRGLGFRR
jgi:hypothetical protein